MLEYKSIVTEGDTTVLPIDEGFKLAVFAFVDSDEQFQSGATFFRFLAQALENDCDFGFVDENITIPEIDSIAENVGKVDVVILAFFYQRYDSVHTGTNKEKLSGIAARLSAGLKTVSVFFGNAMMKHNIKSNLTICTKSLSESSIAAVTLVLSGRTPTVEKFT